MPLLLALPLAPPQLLHRLLLLLLLLLHLDSFSERKILCIIYRFFLFFICLKLFCPKEYRDL
ncbi:hypothetical protein OIU77_006959 [Salix suchowensis]|uniref:Uncharacterized protein n=1 Tax=Salix suchowensis TaxID=1278906 RepID=A0ABQ9AMH2_9ROSI|nr:hypothetical protein OIU77_006959 [Salix suchowensis]